MGSGIGGHDIPHFGLALRVVAFPGQLVVGVYLDREVLPGVDELDQQREFVAETLVVGLAQQCGAVTGQQIREFGTGLGTVRNDGFVAFDPREFPALTDVVLFGFDLFVGGDLLAAPDQGFQNRLKLVHVVYAFCASS